MKMDNKEFKPRMGISQRYSLTEEQKKHVEERNKIKQELIQKYLNYGYTKENAERTAMMAMYIPGFVGPTFKD
jgi:hypothetical protein